MASASTEHELNGSRHRWSRHLEGVTDPASDIKVFVHYGRLLISLKGEQIDNLELPPTAYTGGDAHASYQRGTLTVEMAAKDPAAPAMVEKALMDPDRPRPRELPLHLGGAGGQGGTASGVPNREDPTGRHTATPAEIEYGERNDELFGRPKVRAVMPGANISSSVAADMPMLTNP
ncbi:hypothetical protein GPECTOR_78g98 [Gonium pectorale]|uniref:SHSP domain-containing protein n=1 Tax=Gonium pectorale TaxID=33097 RepID=A0A150G3M3_GONPE|nr:hypothetical protein GPECTOR_78g98 [Gonium pectorale]|eukprot:KXZ43910.1 hypothetical protein GPECTOR_78g98 [Gonium pectorale]